MEKELPLLRKKYEGKYWKYDNGVDHEHRWPLYSYCKKVIDLTQGLFDTFESTKTGYEYVNIFKFNQKEFLNLCQKEITKKEYQKALEKFQKELNKLKNMRNISRYLYGFVIGICFE
ncbi:MAG: hypothetical protein KatS3mg035_1082 [Bacteroidia bacterium]|nr:MAG: hypothetical protein KatS3mg035_1082 [Bacteroidia bacterium]